MKLEDYFKNGKVYVWKRRFAIVKAKRAVEGALATIEDKKEITVVIDEDRIKEEDVIEKNEGWKIVTFDMVLPFELVGFITKVSQILTEEGVSIFVISAYSTDHILVKEGDLPGVIKKLEELGCIVNKVK
jgi:hypothetical protein